MQRQHPRTCLFLSPSLRIHAAFLCTSWVPLDWIAATSDLKLHTSLTRHKELSPKYFRVSYRDPHIGGIQ